MDRSEFVYASYIAASAGLIWNALIESKMTANYWQHENVSDWQAGSRWEHRGSDQKANVDIVGKVLEFSPPRRLVLTWAFPADESREEKHSIVTIDIEPCAGVERLTVTQSLLEPGSEMLHGISEGWPKVISSLKSLLEVGHPLPKLW